MSKIFDSPSATAVRHLCTRVSLSGGSRLPASASPVQPHARQHEIAELLAAPPRVN
jgi:hypothetical protein